MNYEQKLSIIQQLNFYDTIKQNLEKIIKSKNYKACKKCGLTVNKQILKIDKKMNFLQNSLNETKKHDFIIVKKKKVLKLFA